MTARRWLELILLVGVTSMSCGPEAMTSEQPEDASGTAETLSAATCVTVPSAPDAVRHVVVSHPFDASGNKTNAYEVFTLSSAGTLTATKQVFHMGVAISSENAIVFTPNGMVGLASQDDGSIGVFRFEPSGAVTVVHAAFKGAFNAGQLLLSPEGKTVYLLDYDVEKFGGGLHAFDLSCDGHLSNERLVLAGDNASAAAWSGAELLVAARQFEGNGSADLHLLGLTDTGAHVVSSGTGYEDHTAVPPTVSVSADGRWIVMPDNGYEAGNRLAFFERTGTTLTRVQTATTPSPVGVAFSPFGPLGLLVNSDGNDAYRLVARGSSSFVVGNPLAYKFGKPQLPGVPTVIQRGKLKGRVLIGETDAIRQLQFNANGTISDVSRTKVSGTGNAQLVGTIGVAP